MSETDKAPATPPEQPQAGTATPAAQPLPETPPATQAVSVPPPPTPPAATTQPVVVPSVPPTPRKRCLDCGAELEGKYCIACGQRAQLRSLSLPALAHDAIHDLAHFDSRGWFTLRALLFRPGFLTNEFVHGRRTRYLPPFRLYLVLSLVFFVVLSCKPSEEALVINTDVSGQPSGVVTGADPAAMRQAMEELKQELAAESTADPKKAAAADKAAAALSQVSGDPDSGLFEGADCKDMNWDAAGKAWFEPRLRSLCESTKGVSKRQFGRELFRNVPKMMFLFLPLLALVNLVLYVFRRRKYVEHLLFYVHFHAFAFLLLTLQMLLIMVLGWARLPFLSGLVTFASVVYLFVALFKAMRTVYGQSRLMTSLKYLVVLMAYGVFSLLTLLGTMLYTAMTV